MTQSNGNSKKVTVIGLGLMGATLARVLVRQGYQVTVWNRTIEKAEPLAREGASVASSAAEAIGASPLVVVCVYDYKAANEILSVERSGFRTRRKNYHSTDDRQPARSAGERNLGAAARRGLY